jgi:predicted aspartyl protease
MVRFLGAWVLFVGLCAGLAGCAPTAPATCQPTKLADLPVQFADDVMPAVNVTINNHATNLLLDTGAGATIITTGSVKTLAIPISDTMLRDRGLAAGFKNAQFVLFTDPVPLAIGHMKIEQPLIVDHLNLPFLNGQTVSGLLGNDILGNYNLSLDMAHHNVSLYRMNGCSQLPAPWTGADSIAYQTMQGGRIILPITIEGKLFHFNLDTGSSGTIINRASLAAAGLHPIETPVNGDASNQMTESDFKNITVGRETYSGTIGISTSQIFPMLDIDGILGEDYLQHHILYINRQTLTIYVTN